MGADTSSLFCFLASLQRLRVAFLPFLRVSTTSSEARDLSPSWHLKEEEVRKKERKKGF